MNECKVKFESFGGFRTKKMQNLAFFLLHISKDLIKTIAKCRLIGQ
jgi:hypothetical protein